MFFSTKLNKLYNTLLRLIILIISYVYIYSQIFYRESFNDIYKALSSINFHLLSINFSILIALMFINWGIETVKWRFLIRRIEVLSFFKAFVAVLSGVTVSTFLPNRTGEYLGRVFIFNKANRIQGILITIIGSISQLLITVILGLISLIFILKYYFFSVVKSAFLPAPYLLTGIVILNVSVIILCLFFYFNISSLAVFINRFGYLRKLNINKYIRVFSFYTNKELLKVIFLSLFRYLVFTFQFYLILRFLGLNIPVFKAFIFISIIFFITTIIPTIIFTEPTVKGTVALSFFSFYFADIFPMSESIKIALLTSTSALWIINIIIPAIIGSLFVFRLKFFRKN